MDRVVWKKSKILKQNPASNFHFIQLIQKVYNNYPALLSSLFRIIIIHHCFELSSSLLGIIIITVRHYLHHCCIGIIVIIVRQYHHHCWALSSSLNGHYCHHCLPVLSSFFGIIIIIVGHYHNFPLNFLRGGARPAYQTVGGLSAILLTSSFQ